VQLPASEIDRCGFHGFGVWLVRLEADAGFANKRVSGNFKLTSNTNPNYFHFWLDK
jgi:hypothetical protein